VRSKSHQEARRSPRPSLPAFPEKLSVESTKGARFWAFVAPKEASVFQNGRSCLPGVCYHSYQGSLVCLELFPRVFGGVSFSITLSWRMMPHHRQLLRGKIGAVGAFLLIMTRRNRCRNAKLCA
jgi:hypothetical protein